MRGKRVDDCEGEAFHAHKNRGRGLVGEDSVENLENGGRAKKILNSFSSPSLYMEPKNG